MKKWFLMAIAIFGCSFNYAINLEKIETLASKVTLQNSDGYFVLSDGSCWKVIGFSKRWRTISEWWNNVQLIPENYECVPKDWYLGTEIQAYSKYNNLAVDEANASNQEALRQCTHLLVNTRTNQVLFAIALHPAECIVQLFNEAQEDGYNAGLVQGRLENLKDAKEIYNSGYTEGHKVGYNDGYQDAIKTYQASR